MNWDLDARLATDSLRRIVEPIRPLCHKIVEQNGITPHQLMALDQAVNGVRWVFADFDARNPHRGLPMPRWVAGLIEIWLWVNAHLPAETTERLWEVA